MRQMHSVAPYFPRTITMLSHQNNVEELVPLYRLDLSIGNEALYGDPMYLPPTLEGFKRYCRKFYTGQIFCKEGQP